MKSIGQNGLTGIVVLVLSGCAGGVVNPDLATIQVVPAPLPAIQSIPLSAEAIALQSGAGRPVDLQNTSQVSQGFAAAGNLPTSALGSSVSQSLPRKQSTVKKSDKSVSTSSGGFVESIRVLNAPLPEGDFPNVFAAAEPAGILLTAEERAMREAQLRKLVEALRGK
ncbi:MAG: hypothetical protein JKY49_02545 [Cohaesibacteraceae bacterium]|nr:hypothetical protein [Cohaesibacteraceae bacterium]